MLLDDLDWLGFSPHQYPTSEFRRGACESRQSDRVELYAEQAAALRARGLVYGCRCTRSDMARAQTAEGTSTGTCPGTCRDRGIAPAEGVAWRLYLGGVPEGERFNDLLAGVADSRTSEAGDPVIRDRVGNWTYQFAVTVDDFQQGVDLVIRGADLLESSSLQVRIARLIGRATPPRFAHHPLIMKSPTQKLSKSDGDTGIRHLRDAGRTPGEVIGDAAFLVGLTEISQPIHANEVARLFA